MEPDDEGSTRWHQHPRKIEDDSLDEDVSEGDQAQHRAELGLNRREVLRDKGEGGHVGHKRSVLMDVEIVEGGGGEEDEGEVSRVRVGGCGLPDDEVLLLSGVQPHGSWDGSGEGSESKEAEKEEPKAEAARARAKGAERAKGW